MCEDAIIHVGMWVRITSHLWCQFETLVALYSDIKLDIQITESCKQDYDIHIIRKFQNTLHHEAACTIIHTSITRQIDCCKVLMNGLPEVSPKKQKKCSKHRCQTSFYYDHITTAGVMLNFGLQSDAGLNAEHFIFKGPYSKTPSYTQEMIAPVSKENVP